MGRPLILPSSPEVAAIADWSQLEALTSDHIAIVIILSDTFTNVPESLGQPKWDTNKANWKTCADTLHELSADDTDKIFLYMTSFTN